MLPLERVVDYMPDGVALLDVDCVIQWANPQFWKWFSAADPSERRFYEVLGNPELLGPDYCPFNTALVMNERSDARVRTSDNRFFHFNIAPVRNDFLPTQQLIVTLREVTKEVLQHQMMEAIHQAGSELASLLPQEVGRMAIEDRVNRLREDILHFTQHLLRFDVIEIRLLNPQTKELKSLLSHGLDRVAADRTLWASMHDNGVTGFVAASGRSYLCEDTARDPLYLTGFEGAKSSMTVPLMRNQQVIGTFNVESPEPRGFSEADLQFLEIFSREVAEALNKLDLLQAQQADTAWQSVEAIHREVAGPIDEILNAVVLVTDRYLDDKCPDRERMKQILLNARAIKDVIVRVGAKIAPAETLPASDRSAEYPGLRDRRVLVVVGDSRTRSDAHRILEKYACIVETAHDGTEAELMIRSCEGDNKKYDVVISDIVLPDMSGYQLMQRLKPHYPVVPLILMQEFGHDPRHIVVNARKEGLHEKAVVIKPLKPDQIVKTVDIVVAWVESLNKREPQMAPTGESPADNATNITREVAAGEGATSEVAAGEGAIREDHTGRDTTGGKDA
jgi:CheY-like chemotaxis protein